MSLPVISLAVNFLLFLFGTIIGSFLNVVAIRYNSGKGILGRSACMSCNKKLCWYELVPVLSFCALGGKCLMCKSRISAQYPIVEILSGLGFVLLYHKWLYLFPSFGLFLFVLLFSFMLYSLLLVIAVYDFRHRIIPDALVFAFVILSGLFLFVSKSSFGDFLVIPSFMSFLAGPLVAAPFALIWLVSRGRWMGLGDAKLMLGAGFLLGLASGYAAVLLSFWIGGLISLFLLVFFRKYFSMKSEIPFAPFLILSVMLVFLFGIDFFGIMNLLNFSNGIF